MHPLNPGRTDAPIKILEKANSYQSPCECYERLPAGSSRQELGVDKTYGRYGDVLVTTCCTCGRRWLHYFAEYEAFTASQRWIRGILPSTQVVPFPPEEAVPIFNRMPWYSYHLSGHEGQCGRGNAPADLTCNGGEPVEIDYSAEEHHGLRGDETNQKEGAE